MWYIYAVEYYWDIKRNKVLMPITTYINLGNIMVRERKPVPEHSVRFHLYELSEQANPLKKKENNYLAGAGASGQLRMKLNPADTRIPQG